MITHPNQYQFYTFDKYNRLIHAGVHGAARLSKKAALKQERKWLIWRRQYIANHPGNYPLTQMEVPAVVVMFPIDNPQERITANL